MSASQALLGREREPMSDEIARMLYEGALAVTQGRHGEAQALLMQVIERDEHNEQAWLWLSGAVLDPADQEVALENVLELNPNNIVAQQGLIMLRSQSGGNAAPATQGEWQPPPPISEDQVDEFTCWQCGASLYSVAQYCWQCHAPIHACNNCYFRGETRCKELQGLTNAILQSTRNDCPWWRINP
jgi:hypothetical protein